MPKRKRVNAIFDYDKNVSQLLTNTSTFYNTLGSSPASTHVIIAPADLAAAQGRVADARAAEEAAGTRTIGLAAARDLALSGVMRDVRNFVLLVQTAADVVLDPATARMIVMECGLTYRRDRSNVKNRFTVSNDANSVGRVLINFKATPKGVNACYETQMSTDNINWIYIKTSTDSTYTYVHGMEPGTKLYFRGRVILSEKKGGAQSWIFPPTTYLFVI